jgi:GxxExxY protein
VFDGIIGELKAVSQLLPEHEAQLINYMRITKQPLGYLINFGKPGGLDFKRIILSEYLPK